MLFKMLFYSLEFIFFNIIVIQTNGEFCNFYIKNSDIFYSLKEQSLFFSCLKRKENVTFVVVLSKQAV